MSITDSLISSDRAYLNVCVAYSSQEEMTTAVQRTSESGTVESNLYSAANPHWTDPDILIRTSGVSRLSDFLLWQVSPTYCSTLYSEAHLPHANNRSASRRLSTSCLATGQIWAWLICFHCYSAGKRTRSSLPHCKRSESTASPM